MSREEFVRREKNLNHFIAAKNHFQKWQIMAVIGLNYVMTDESLGLDEPYFQLIEVSDLDPRLYLYRAADPESVSALKDYPPKPSE